MTAQSTLNCGDIITVKKTAPHLLVVSTNHRDGDVSDQDCWVIEIACIEIANDRWGKPMKTMQYQEPGLKRFYITGPSGMKGAGRLIKDSDVTVVGTSKVHTYTTITHVMEDVHYYGNT